VKVKLLAVQWGFDGEAAALEDVGVDHGGFDILMSIPSPIMDQRKAEKRGEWRPNGRFVEKCLLIKWHQVFSEAFLLSR
jgi:hypothetical protein